ncbi:hypothetical protein SNARM312S_03599 [Streptomyces narbonensis]
MPPAPTIGHPPPEVLAPRVHILIPRIPRLEYAGAFGHSTLGRTSPDS